MQFIKKLVILTGSGARGTLILEKNSFGVWGKLNLFDLAAGEYKLVVISGDELFVMNVDGIKSSTTFELGEINYAEIHAAVVSDRVAMYGSNCAKKLSDEYILKKVRSRIEMVKKEAGCITFSSADQKIDDYFKQIAPPEYNDFAIAEKNYYPAYVTFVGQVAATEENAGERGEEGNAKVCVEAEEESKNIAADTFTQEKDEVEKIKVNEEENREHKTAIKAEENFESKQSSLKKDSNEIKERAKMMPYQLERKYLSLMSVATTAMPIAKQKENVKDDKCLYEHISFKTMKKPETAEFTQKATLKNLCKESPKPMGRQATYFERSSMQLDKLLGSNERFSVMEKIIPGSKFVKINYDNKRFYIVGAIGKDYICYGVPAVFSPAPPQPLCGYARWLPLYPDKPKGEGFWMMYQDGITGETLKNDG